MAVHQLKTLLGVIIVCMLSFGYLTSSFFSNGSKFTSSPVANYSRPAWKAISLVQSLPPTLNLDMVHLSKTIIEASNLNQGDMFPKNLTSNPIAAEMAGRILTQVGRPWIDDAKCREYVAATKVNRTVKYNILDSPLDMSPITLVTHMTAERIAMLEHVARHWNYMKQDCSTLLTKDIHYERSISVSLYATHEDLLNITRQYNQSAALQTRTNIYIHFVPIEGPSIYPVNFLRNVAIKFNTRSKYVFLSDIDFVPAFDMGNILEGYLDKYDLKKSKQMLIVPAFEILENARDPTFPRDKPHLLTQWRLGNIHQFHKKFVDAHGPVNYERWKNAKEPYEAKHHFLFEPYLVAYRSALPLFPERFVGRYRDKVAHVTFLNTLGFRFLVIPDVFTVHLPHLITKELQRPYRKCAVREYNEFAIELKYLQRALT